MSVSSIESSTTSATIDDDLERFSYFTPNLHWEPTYMWARYNPEFNDYKAQLMMKSRTGKNPRPLTAEEMTYLQTPFASGVTEVVLDFPRMTYSMLDDGSDYDWSEREQFVVSTGNVLRPLDILSATHKYFTEVGRDINLQTRLSDIDFQIRQVSGDVPPILLGRFDYDNGRLIMLTETWMW